MSLPQAMETATRLQNLWVLGAGGMLAGELLRLAAQHPELHVAGAVTREGGEALDELHPHLASGTRCQRLEQTVAALVATVAADEAAWLVLALPHAEAAAAWSALRAELGHAAERVGVIDLSADYRLQDRAAYARWYGQPHADPGELARFVYGLPELAPPTALAGATRIAAPGCFATALQLACVPAARAGLVDDAAPWVIHAVTGSSGSGNKPRAQTHHPHRHGNLWAYPSDGHRHEAELSQALGGTGLLPRVIFLPHSGPWSRGIHLSAVLPLASDVPREVALEAYRACYAPHPFVDVLTEGTPDLRRVVGSNTAALGLRVRAGTLVVEVTLDNLIKGGSGQALQALNLAAGLPETLGLPHTGLGTI